MDEDKGHYTNLQVLKSAAGFYIGRMYEHDEGWTEPGSRESGYFPSWEAAELAFKEGFEIRQCAENKFSYDTGVLPDLRVGAKKLN